MESIKLPEGMTEEEYDRRLRFQKLDQQVFDIFGHNDKAYDFYQDYLKESFQFSLKKRVNELEIAILQRDLQIASLKKENDLIWKTSIEKLAEEKLKNRLKEVGE